MDDTEIVLHIEFTERALASRPIGRGASEELRRFPVLPLAGDVLRLPASQTTLDYVVSQRRFELDPGKTVIVLELDLPPRPATLRAV